MSRAIPRLLLCLMLLFLVVAKASASTKVQVEVDPRIELLSIVQYLADYDAELAKIDPSFGKQCCASMIMSPFVLDRNVP